MDPPPFYRAPANNHPVARASFQKPVAIPKAPIVNPYEKFTQPQFDAWIGDITGALRGALGYRAEVPQKPKARTKWHIPAPHSNEAPDAAYEDEDADEELEDSFAEVKARGAAVKGKGRDPREGPGLGRGDRAAPIEIDLDSGEEEEEDQDQDQEEELDEEDSWDENEGMGSDDEEEENALRNGESSARAHARYKKYAERYDDRAEQDEDEHEGREDDVGPDAVEVISDEEEDEPHANGLQTQDGEEDGEEYSDEENAFPTALLVAPQKRTLVTEEGGYSDDGEETGSESENEIGSSPPRPFEDEDEELEDDEIDSSPRRPQRGEPEVINLDSDEEEPAGEEEEERLADDGEEDGQDEHETLRAPLNFSTQQDDQDDDVLPGSSPILSSPIEAEQSFQSFPSEHQDHEIFNVDEDDEDMNDAHNDSQSFDWNNPPAFEQGVPASGPGHLATPVEDDNVVDSDGYPPLQVFGTSDLLSTFNSQSQTESGSNDIPLQFHPLEFDEQYVFAAGPSSFLSAPGYFVTEADEQVLPENLEYSDAYTVSRDISVDPQHFTVEEAFTDHEPDGRGMSLDVATLDGEMEGADVGAENYDAILDDIRSTQYPSAEMVAAAFEATYSDGVVHKEEPQSQFFEVPMPISADPAVHDPFGSRPATPPRPPASLGFPGSPLLVSPVGTPTGQPTPVAIPVPASFLKAMHERQESSLFTPRSEIPSGGTTPLAGEGVQAEPVVEVVDVDEVDDEENAAIVNATDDASVEVTEVEENAEAPGIPLSTIDTEVEVEEPRETQDLITDVTELEPIEEISSSTEEIAPQRGEENSADATLPLDDAPSALELDIAAPIEQTEPTEDPIVVDDSDEPHTNGNGADLTIAHTEDLVPNNQEEQDSSSSSAFPTKMTLAASATPVLEFDPYPYSLSTPGEHEHPDPVEAISGESSSAGDGEEKTDGERDDASSAATSQEQHNGDELNGMELQYPEDVKGAVEVEGDVEDVEESNAVEGGDVEESNALEGVDVEGQDVEVREDVGDADVDAVLDVEVEDADLNSAATSQEQHDGGEMDGMELQYPEDVKEAVEEDVGDVEQSNVVEGVDVQGQDLEVVEDVDDGDVDAVLDVEVEEAVDADDLKAPVDVDVEEGAAAVEVADDVSPTVDADDLKAAVGVDVEEGAAAVEGADDVSSTVDVDVEEVAEANPTTDIEVEDVETADDEVEQAQMADVEGAEAQIAEVEPAESSVEGTDEEASDASETDADGVDDPDYEDSSSAASVAGEQTIDDDVEEQPADAAEASAAEEDAPRELEIRQETNGAIESVETPNIPEKHEVNGDAHRQENGSVVEKMDYVEIPEASSSLAGVEKEPSPQLTQEVEVDEDEDEDEIIAESPPESLKRKRKHSPTGGNMGKMAESRLLRPNGKGKGKAKEEYVDDDGASSTSSASSAARLLDPGSVNSSRASSVASAPSSVVIPNSSPSLPRMNSIIRVARLPPKPPPPPPLAPPPPPMMHAHSHNRTSYRNPPPMSRHATQQRMLQRTPSRASIHEESPPPTPSSSSMPAPPPRAPPAAGSPVTRSNCRYHKISLPENDEDKMGRRVFFVVPGCSLGDSELMKEEFILDLGDATQEEGDTMIKDLDELQLSPYLVGIIRQLVGVDILREQEVYYLPRPGEGLRKPQRRGKSKLRISSAGSGSFAAGSEAGGSGMGRMSPSSMRSPASVISSRPPNSVAGSSSTVSTQTKRGRKKAVPSSNRGSPTPSWVMSPGGDESTDEDESPAAKKVRAAEEEGIAAAASGTPLRTRRSKRMNPEAAEYKPDPAALEAAAESSEEDEDKGKRKKKRRGVKRGRHSEAVPTQDGGDERKTKKLKTQESNGGSAS